MFLSFRPSHALRRRGAAYIIRRRTTRSSCATYPLPPQEAPRPTCLVAQERSVTRGSVSPTSSARQQLLRWGRCEISRTEASE